MDQQCSDCGGVDFVYSEGCFVCTSCGLCGLQSRDPEEAEIHRYEILSMGTRISPSRYQRLCHVASILYRLNGKINHERIGLLEKKVSDFCRAFDKDKHIFKRKNMINITWIIRMLAEDIYGTDFANAIEPMGFKHLKTLSRQKQYLRIYDHLKLQARTPR
jgi:hypothetical protein